jgi:predicted phosphodiesterase
MLKLLLPPPIRIRPGLIIAALLAAASLTSFAGEPFKFLLFTDIHLGWGRHDSHGCIEMSKRAQEVEKDAAFVVVTGDLLDKSFNEPNPEALAVLKEFLGSFSIPVHCIPGNHDFCHWRHEESVAMRCVRNYQKFVGPISGSFECKGYRMVLFCELPLTKWCPKLEGYDPLPWLENTLSTQPPEPAIIFMHVPPDRSWYPEDLKKWKEIVKKNDVKAVICGHHHADELSWENQGMPVLAAYACTNKDGNTPSFKVYNVDKDGKISFRTHYLVTDRRGERL